MGLPITDDDRHDPPRVLNLLIFLESQLSRVGRGKISTPLTPRFLLPLTGSQLMAFGRRRKVS